MVSPVARITAGHVISASVPSIELSVSQLFNSLIKHCLRWFNGLFSKYTIDLYHKVSCQSQAFSNGQQFQLLPSVPIQINIEPARAQRPHRTPESLPSPVRRGHLLDARPETPKHPPEPFGRQPQRAAKTQQRVESAKAEQHSQKPRRFGLGAWPPR